MRIKILLFIICLFFYNVLYGAENLETLFTRGLNYYIQRQYKKAALEWKQILEKDPEHRRARVYMEKAFTKHNIMEINFYKGLELFNKEKFKEAVPFFQETLMVNPRHEKALYYTELCYKLLKQVINRKEASEQAIAEAQNFLEEEEFTKAIAMYKIAVLIDPDNQDARMKITEAENKDDQANQNLELMLHLQAANEYHDKKEYVQAIQEWSKALMLDPNNKEAKKGLKNDQELLKQQQLQEKVNELLSRGIDLFLNNEYNQSRDVFRQVLKLDPKNKTAGEYVQKIDEILEKINQKKLQENEAEKHYILGVDFFNKKEYEKALNEFDFTLSIIPTHQNAIDFRKKTLEMLEKSRQEEEEKKNVSIQKMVNEGIQLYQFGEYENAVYNFRKIIEMEPENKYAPEYLKLSEEALRMQKLSVINEDSPYYPIVRSLEAKGMESYNRKDYQAALQYFNEIKDLFPLNKEANRYVLMIMRLTSPEKIKSIIDMHFEKGKKYYDSKNYTAAFYEFDLVKSIAPDYPQIDKFWNLASKPPSVSEAEIRTHFDKGLLYFSQKDYENAVKEWRKAVELDRSPLSNKYLAKSLANISKAEFRLNTSKGKVTPEQVGKLSKEKLKLINKHYYMGIAYYTSGDFPKALQEFQAVLKLDPNNAMALKNVEKIRKRL